MEDKAENKLDFLLEKIRLEINMNGGEIDVKDVHTIILQEHREEQLKKLGI